MPDPIVPNSNGASSQDQDTPKKSLRETIEAAWDKVVEDAPDPDADAGGEVGDEPQPVDTGTVPRDERGRFASREAKPGEAAQRPQQAEHPAPPQASQQGQPHPAPPPAGEAAQAPANWSAEDRANFDKLPEGWARDFILRRHSELESDYQRKSQATAAAANFAQAVAPVFNDPRIAQSLREAGVSAAEAISQWGGFHLRFMTDPAGMILDLCRHARIDPATLARTAGVPGSDLPQDALKDPAIKFIADHLGQQHNDVVTLRNELQAMRAAGEARQQQEVMRVTRWGIDSFADEKDQQGNPLHPHFDHPQVMQNLIRLYRADPGQDLNTAYETAVMMVPELRAGILQGERQRLDQRQSDKRAAQQVRSNLRGRTQPVEPPPAQPGQKRSLRDTLEAAADAVGLE